MEVSPGRVVPPKPMLAMLGELPAGSGYSTEIKWDGFRLSVSADQAGVDVYTRGGADASSTFPELAGIRDALGGRQAVLDGELVALDGLGRPSFSRLQQRWPMRRRPAAALLRQVPVRFYAFDVVGLDGRDLTGLAYSRRREVLDELGAAASGSSVFVVPPAWVDVDPREVLATAEEHGLEGVVAKRLDSLYVPGRSRAWIKRPIRRTCELVIIGWSGGRQVGSLLLAGHDADGQLVVVSEVGTGFSGAERRRLYRLLVEVPRSTSAAAGAPEDGPWRWVEPVYVGEVAYREYTGRGLRHGTWKGLRQRAIDGISVPPLDD